jgi:hypothetical protein
MTTLMMASGLAAVWAAVLPAVGGDVVGERSEDGGDVGRDDDASVQPA